MKNYTSTVPPERSIAEIEALLVRAGARGITKEYAGGEVTGLSFTIATPEGAAIFVRLPADAEAVFGVLRKAQKRPSYRPGWERRLREQAKRTAWRLMLDWVAVQMSLIEMRQAELLQVFMPYVWAGQKTVYEHLKGGGFAALTYRGDAQDEEHRAAEDPE